jgi:hypothetical protein
MKAGLWLPFTSSGFEKPSEPGRGETIRYYTVTGDFSGNYQ